MSRLAELMELLADGARVEIEKMDCCIAKGFRVYITNRLMSSAGFKCVVTTTIDQAIDELIKENKCVNS